MIFIFRGPLRRLVGFQRDVQIDADTVQEGLSALCQKYPHLHGVLFDGSGHLRAVHRLALNRTLLLRSELEAPVAVDDEVEVVTALAGG
jgi:molybdopterin converting factor small subunit